MSDDDVIKWKQYIRVTGPLWGESSGHRRIPLTKSVTRSFGVFFHLRRNKRLSKQSWGCWFETPSRTLWRQCNVKWQPHVWTRAYELPGNWFSLTWVSKIKHYSRHDIHYFTACALLYGSNTRTQRKPRSILHLAVTKDWLALWRHANMRHYHCYVNLACCSFTGKLAKRWYQLISPWPDPICLVSFLGCKRNRGVCNAYLY